MRLTLQIENHQTLPDGGPTSFTAVGRQGFDIGRGQYLDWTLPDESRVISGRHCEIRPQGDAYYLYDVSRNGTFINGSETRVQSPYKLKSGDRLYIGDYIIAVSIEGDDAPAEPATAAPPARGPSYDEIWNFEGEVAAPMQPKDLAPRKAPSPAYGDWTERPADLEPLTPRPATNASSSASSLDWGVPAPSFESAPQASPQTSNSSPPADWSAARDAADADAGWAPIAPPQEPEAPPAPQAPAPRRAASLKAQGPWAAGHEAAETQPFKAAAAETGAPPPPELAQALRDEEPKAPSAGAPTGDYAAFLSAFAQAAGAPPSFFAQAGAEAFGAQMGALLRLFIDETRRLLEARSAAKRMARSANQTFIQPQDNNPLKFSPTSDEALRILFGAPRPGYLDAQRAFDQAFADLKTHQLRTFGAMQQAVRVLAEDLDPKEIERSLPEDGGVAKLFGSRKARLWDAYVARWEAKRRHSDDGLVDAFLRYYADCYDRANGGH